MYTVLCIDLQLVSAFGRFHVLVNTGRAITPLRPIVGGKVDVDGNRAVFEGQVRRLVFFVVGVADEHTGELVKAEDAIRLGVGNGLGLCRGFETGVVCLVVVQSPRGGADTDFGQSELLYAGHELAHPFAFFEPVFEIAGLVQFLVKPAVFEMGGVGRQFVVRATFGNRHKGSFRGEHA